MELNVTGEIVPNSTLDTSGTWCPEPIMLLSERIESLESGDQVQLISTDPASKRDVPKYCSAMGHHLIEQTEDNDQFEFLIQLR